MTLRRWDRQSSRPLSDYRIFRVREDVFRSPRTGRDHGFYVIECDDWVNVIALTEEREVLMVRQHRFGVDALTLEIPGGMIDPGESPAEAAARELREETGFAPAEVVALGTIHPNPALQPNLAHTFLALGCKPCGELDQDELEDLEVVKVPVDRIDAMLEGGEISHALVAVAFLHWKLRGSPGR